MAEISEKKKRFLESIGIDINNLPPEFERHSDTIESTLSKEEIEFLNRESLTGRYQKSFCLKDLAATWKRVKSKGRERGKNKSRKREQRKKCKKKTRNSSSIEKRTYRKSNTGNTR